MPLRPASVTPTYQYDAFGAIRSQTGSAANDWLFTGEQRVARPQRWQDLYS